MVKIDNIRNLRSYNGGKESITHCLYICPVGTGTYLPVLRIQFLGPPDPDPLVRGTDPDPSIIKQ